MRVPRRIFSRILLAAAVPVLLAGLCACRSEVFTREELPDLCEKIVKQRESLPPQKAPRERMIQCRLVIEKFLFSISSVCMIHIQGQKITAAALLPAGIKLFEVSGTPEKVERFYFPESMPLAGDDPEKSAAQLLKDLHNIFHTESFTYRKCPPGFHRKRTKKILHLIHPEKGIRLQYGYHDLRLLKKSEKNQSSNWQTYYYRCIVKGPGLYPVQIVYQNKKGGYSLIFRVYDLHLTDTP